MTKLVNNLIALLLVGGWAYITPLVSLAVDWPQFRGANCAGISAAKVELPERFSPTENVKWSAELGDGVGSVVVAAGRTFVSAMSGPETVSLFAFDTKSGKKLWQRDWATGQLSEVHKTNSQASATPAADDERCYFYFSTLGLRAVDAKTGADVWHFPMPTPFFVFKWGPGASPVLHRDTVLFCQDDDLNPALYAIDKATGKLRWKDERLDMAVNYTHPVVCSANGQEDIVVGGTGILIGYDPQTGARRWTAKIMLRNIKTTPVVENGIIYISVQSGGIANQWLAAVDQGETGNRDGKIDRKEIQSFVGNTPIPEAFFRKTFERGDIDGNGYLEGRELDVAFMHPDNFAGATFTSLGEKAAEQFIMAVRGGGTGDVTNTHVVWKHATRHTDHIVSPFVADQRILLIKEGGISTVFETSSGNPLREPKRVGAGGSYFASPIFGDGKIFLASDNGKVVVLRNNAQFEELASNDFGESIISTPAISEDGLLIRTRTKLYCIAK